MWLRREGRAWGRVKFALRMDGHVRLKLDQTDLSGGGVDGEVVIAVVAIAVILSNCGDTN